MFGPNHKPRYHHREPYFEKMYSNLVKTFRDTFGVSDDFLVLPITGSGTLSLEMVLNNIKCGITFKNTEFEFGKRLSKLYHKDSCFSTVEAEAEAEVQYETSESILNVSSKEKNIRIMDCVSSFPFYQVPEDVDIWVTVNSKQLKCSPGISFIVIRKSILDYIEDESFSYCSLARYINYATFNQTPNTPAINIFEETLNSIKKFNIEKQRKLIKFRREQLQNLFGVEGGTGPVFTLENNEKVKKIKEKWNLYGKNNTQLFLWSGTNKEYEDFIKGVKNDFMST